MQVFGGAIMARYKPRFRISIKDQATGKKLKIELLPMPWRGRFAIRQNGRRPRKRPFGTTSEVFARLRSWVAQQRSYTLNLGSMDITRRATTNSMTSQCPARAFPMPACQSIGLLALAALRRKLG